MCDGAACAQIRLTNEKIAAVLAVEGAKTVMLTMGWVEDGNFLVKGRAAFNEGGARH